MTASSLAQSITRHSYRRFLRKFAFSATIFLVLAFSTLASASRVTPCSGSEPSCPRLLEQLQRSLSEKGPGCIQHWRDAHYTSAWHIALMWLVRQARETMVALVSHFILYDFNGDYQPLIVPEELVSQSHML